ncbi:MAG: hypothetical protein QG608_2643 [Actinomycetota bacterium]|nr:hypothetical protein [Actinomycetota bacterium]
MVGTGSRAAAVAALAAGPTVPTAAPVGPGHRLRHHRSRDRDAPRNHGPRTPSGGKEPAAVLESVARRLRKTSLVISENDPETSPVGRVRSLMDGDTTGRPVEGVFRGRPHPSG